MTTAEQLMSDLGFCMARVEEQDEYLNRLNDRLDSGEIDGARYVELGESAYHQRAKFEVQAMKLSGRMR